MRLAWLLLLAVPLAGCGGPYADDLALPPPAAQEPWGVWRFDAAGALLPAAGAEAVRPVYRLTGHPGAEPNIGATSSGALFLSSYDETLRSTDGGQTWEVVYDFAPSPVAPEGPETGDPMLWVDTVTDRVYANHMYPSLVCFFTAWSEDDGGSWQENPASCTLPAGVDHQKFFSAPPGPLAPALAGQLHPTVLFQCYQRVLGTPATGILLAGYQTQCNLSYDGGAHWPYETTAATRLPGSCGGINGHPGAAPDGTVVIPITLGCDGLYLSVSLDSGLTWTVRPGPKEVGAESIDAEVAFTPDGTLYALWRGSDHLTYLARSADVGLTWQGPWQVSPPHLKSTVFEALSAGEDGRIAMAFLGTEDTGEHPSSAPNETRWHLYVVTSEDAGGENPTFTARQVTPKADPVQVGCVWLFGGGHPCRNMLDFIDSTVTPDGTFYVAFTKGCTDGCASHEDKGSITATAWLPGFALHAPAAVAGEGGADDAGRAGGPAGPRFGGAIAMAKTDREG